MKTEQTSQWFTHTLTSGREITSEIRKDGDHLFETGEDYYTLEDLKEIRKALDFVVNLAEIEEEDSKNTEQNPELLPELGSIIQNTSDSKS